jgi:hypothetical protein
MWLQQADEFRNSKTSLADDCAQRPSLEIATMDWNCHIAFRVGCVNETAMAARGSGHGEACTSKRLNNVFGLRDGSRSFMPPV